MTDVVWTRDALIASAESLLALDAKGALTPHGIGHLAREIIAGFLDLVRDADPLPDADGWEPKVGDRVKLVKDGLSTTGAIGMRGFIRDIDWTGFSPYKIELDEGGVYSSKAIPEQYCWTRADRDCFVSAVRPAPSGPVVEETEPKRSPHGWYYQADPKSRSVYRCKLGQAWERMEFTDLEPDAAELRFIADTIESAARQIGEAMEGK